MSSSKNSPDLFNNQGSARSATSAARHQRWRANHPTVTVRSSGRERIYKINPLLTSTMIGVGMLVVVGVLSSSAYLYLRDDLANATLMRQAKMQHLYEDRITNLRAQVDLATSRQLLDQQIVENRVTKLLMRQEKIGAMQREVRQLVKRTGPLAESSSDTFKLPTTPKSAPQINKPAAGLRLGSLVGTSNPFSSSSTGQSATEYAQGNPGVLDSVEESIASTELAQIDEIKKLKKSTDTKLTKLAAILSKQGVQIPQDKAMGGPLIELKTGADLVDTMTALDASLEMLERMRSAAQSLPHGSPSPGQKISSRYGTRKDPFTRRAAVHGGLDFRARRGTPVLATANGKVIKAGRHGGYGKLVEIDHGGGITTRYAHLSKIKVKVGQHIAKGKRVGNVGSTGRSTGPHLHYEVRRKGRTLNPIHFVKLEKRLKPYL